MPGSTPPTAGPAQHPTELAPPWHTALLIALIVMVAAIGTLLTRSGIAVPTPAAPPSRGAIYLQLGLVAWGLLVYVCRIGRPRNALPALLGKGWTSAWRAITDLALATAGWLLLKACELAWLRLVATAPAASVVALLPHTGLERAGWVVVALSVALSEEVVYRGYLQTQLAAFTGRPRVAMVLQALLFGLAHGEQGLGAMLRIAAYGLAFGALARCRQSLLPGILLHAFTNLASGLIRV